MLFSKEFLVQKFNEKINKEALSTHPFETHDQHGEISDGKASLISYHQYFDLRSEEAKDAMLKSRKESTETCFNDNDMGIYPNSEKIENCLENAKIKNFGKFVDNRILYFGNSRNYFFYFSMFFIKII